MPKYQQWQPRILAPANSVKLDLVEQLLVQRNIITEQEKEFFFSSDVSHLEPPPALKDISRAVERISQAMEQGEKIALYGDYDVDGVTATVILSEIFEYLGYNHVVTYLPHRETEGYGLQKQALEELARTGVKLIITVDCGINAHGEIEHAHTLGLEVIVTDHHQVPKKLPAAHAIINPKQAGCASRFKELSGAGLAWKLGWALLAEKTGEKEIPLFSQKQLDLVCLATIADIVPLIGENRIIVKKGLTELQHSERPGLQALLASAGVQKETIDEQAIAFRLAPRLNASGRLEHAKTSFQLLQTKDPASAEALATTLNLYNQKRKTITEHCLAEAIAQIDHHQLGKTIIVKSKTWPSGVIGLVASKLAEQFYRPALALSYSDQAWKGSGRSLDFFHLTAALEQVAPYLDRFGGHARAAGFTLMDEHLDQFEQAFSALAHEHIADESLVPTLLYDAHVASSAIQWELLQSINSFAPFGFQNERPILISRDLELFDVRLVGSKQNHVRFKVLAQQKILDAIAFNFSEHFDPSLRLGDTIDLAYHLEVNVWNSTKTLQLNVLDVKRSQSR